MNPKPLTTLERETIRLQYEPELPNALSLSHLGKTVQKLLAAEAFWREALRRSQPYGIETSYCSLCGMASWEDPTVDYAHKPDCPWLLAQDEE